MCHTAGPTPKTPTSQTNLHHNLYQNPISLSLSPPPHPLDTSPAVSTTLPFATRSAVYPSSMQMPPVGLGGGVGHNNGNGGVDNGGVGVGVGGNGGPVPPTLQSPMANLMSITETLPPGSPRNGPSPPGPPPPQRTASRGSQHSPNSSGRVAGCRFGLCVCGWFVYGVVCGGRCSGA